MSDANFNLSQSKGLHEVDLVTSYTIVVPERIERGAVSLAARANEVIRRALEMDGFELAERPGYAVNPAISTDCYRLAFIPGDDER